MPLFMMRNASIPRGGEAREGQGGITWPAQSQHWYAALAQSSHAMLISISGSLATISTIGVNIVVLKWPGGSRQIRESAEDELRDLPGALPVTNQGGATNDGGGGDGGGRAGGQKAPPLWHLRRGDAHTTCVPRREQAHAWPRSRIVRRASMNGSCLTRCATSTGWSG